MNISFTSMCSKAKLISLDIDFIGSIIITILCTHLFNTYLYNNVFLMALGIDNLCSGAKFIRHHTTRDITMSTIIKLSNNLYNLTSFDRYIYYLLLHILNFLVNTIILNKNYHIIKCCLVVTAIPTILNTVSKKETMLAGLFQKIHNIELNLFRVVYMDQVAYVIKKFANNFVSADITKEDATKFVNGFEGEYDIVSHIKNVLFVFLMMYLRNINIAYYKLSKYVYLYGYGEYITRLNNDSKVAEENAVEMVVNVIRQKDYEQIMKPMFIQNVIFLYCNRGDGTAFAEACVKLNYKFMLAMTLWAMGSFLGVWVILGGYVVLGLGGMRGANNWREGLVGGVVGCGGIMLGGGVITTSFVSVYAYDVFYSKIVKKIIEVVWGFVVKYFVMVNTEYVVFLRNGLWMGVCCWGELGGLGGKNSIILVIVYIVANETVMAKKIINVLGCISIVNNTGLYLKLCFVCYIVCVAHVVIGFVISDNTNKLDKIMIRNNVIEVDGDGNNNIDDVDVGTSAGANVSNIELLDNYIVVEAYGQFRDELKKKSIVG